MARRKTADFTRDIGVDPRFQSFLVQKMINYIMERGKKNLARRIVYDAIDVLIKKSNGDENKGYELFERAINKVKPAVEVKARRVGGSVYQIPAEVRPTRALSLSLRWVIQFAASRPDKTMGLRLAGELYDASQGRGNAIKKKTDVHRMAESNRAFSHYAW